MGAILSILFSFRLPLYCVPVPGLSPWALPPSQGRQEEREGGAGATAVAAVGGLPKRQREEDVGAAGGEGEDAMDCCTVGAIR